MKSSYFQIELWKRKRLQFTIQKESILSFCAFWQAYTYENLQGYGAELIIKHCYVSGDKTAIERMHIDGDKLDEIKVLLSQV